MASRKDALAVLLETPSRYANKVGFTLLNDDLHNGWIQDMVLGEEDETLQAHRGSYKTTCVSVAFAIIMLAYPYDSIGFLRKTDTDVKEVIAQTAKILEHPVTQNLCYLIWGTYLHFTERSTFRLNTTLAGDNPRGTPQLTGQGIGGSLTGKHWDRVFTDDIVNLDDRISRAERERTKLVYQELQNVVNRGGRIFNTGTPWHKEDCFKLMPNIKRYDCHSTGLITPEKLKDIRSRMLPSLFAANYELKHIASEDIIFLDPQTGGDPSLCDQAKWVHVDAAYGGEDYTAFTIARRVGTTIYVFGKLWRKHVDDCQVEIIQYRKAFNAGKIRCENNADKGYLAKQLRAAGERVMPYTESMNKFLKITTYLRGDWKNIVFVQGTDDEYIEQICDYNENAEHDDAPDSLASLIRDMWGKKPDDAARTSALM